MNALLLAYLPAISRVCTMLNACSLLYAAVLTVFRSFTVENDSAVSAFFEVSMSSLLFYCGYAVSIDGGTLTVAAKLVIAILSFMYARFLYNMHVVGIPYKRIDLTGKVFIITGCNTGIGLETAKEIAMMNGTVVMACRSIDKAEIARNEIIKYSKCSESKVIISKLDLCGFDSVRKFVKDFKSKGLPLHCLINNAGVMNDTRSLTQDGFEIVFTSNHLSHFLLTNLLLPELEKVDGRVVNVTSSLHKLCKAFDFDNIMSQKEYTLFGTYSQSKLANILFTMELQNRLNNRNSKVTCNAVHPGCVRTEVTRNMNDYMRYGDMLATPFMKMLQKTPSEGAYCSIHVATSNELNNVGGHYFMHCKSVKMGVAADADAAKKLWDISEKYTGLVK